MQLLYYSSIHIIRYPYRSRTSLTPRLRICPHSTSSAVCSSFCVPASVKRILVVLEYQPVVHRLQLYALGLGPDLPWADEPSPGNLRLSTPKILTLVSLLIPAFSLVHCPHRLTVMLQPVHNAPLPRSINTASIASVVYFSPGHLRRKIT